MNTALEIELPSPPILAQKLIEMCAEPALDVVKLVEVISLDAGLTARFLKVANSPYYGQRERVATLRRAAVVLGVNYIKVVALGFQLAGISEKWKNLPMDLRSLWQGNVLRACLASKLAFHSSRQHSKYKDEAFLVGLLQDMAVPILALAVGEDYVKWLGNSGLYTTEALLSNEEQGTGHDHSSLAGRLCREWSFPPDLGLAIKNHHLRPDPVDPTDRATALWQIAYWVGAVHFNENQQSAPVAADLRDLAGAAFGMDDATLAQAFYEAIEEYEKLHPVFDGVLPPKTEAAALLWRAQELILELRATGPSAPQH